MSESHEGQQPIAKPKSAFAHFQKHIMSTVRADLKRAAAQTDTSNTFDPEANVDGMMMDANVDLGAVQREVSARWNDLSANERETFLEAARADRLRYEEESLERDRQVQEAQERKRQEREKVVDGKRERKPTSEQPLKERKEKRPAKPLTEDQMNAKRARQEVTDKNRDERNELKAEEARQKAELEQKKAESAAARLKYLLGQSDVFRHFGVVAPTTVGKKGKKSEREEDDELLHDKHDTVRLTVQPSVIKFGKMRQYQLEGLSWMVNLANKGINMILADEMGLGKTLQTISVLGYMLEVRLCLCVCLDIKPIYLSIYLYIYIWLF
jgi:SWI/SNF-related matrix-associated actin-dependent regulator of chromatin subfamily A member 5